MSAGVGSSRPNSRCYVVLNPVRAQLVRQAGEWPWRSYRATALQGQGPAWLTVDVKSGTPEEIGQAYREYGYRLREIAQHLGVHYATVSRRLKRAESQR